MTILFKKIDHINIVVKDIKKAKDFFLKLGFALETESILEGEWIDILTGLKNVKAEHIGFSFNDSEIKIELLRFINPETLNESSNGVLNKTGFRHVAFE